jgi:hypothetical protein
VILNGSVEVTYPDGKAEILCMGNSFGVSPTMDKEYMKGVMRTKVDDCQVQNTTVMYVSFLVKNSCVSRAPVAHAYNSSYTGEERSTEWRFQASLGKKKSQTLSQKYPTQKMVGIVVQVMSVCLASMRP